MSEKVIATTIRHCGSNNRVYKVAHQVTIVDRATGESLAHCEHTHGHTSLPAFKACATRLWVKRGNTAKIVWSR